MKVNAGDAPESRAHANHREKSHGQPYPGGFEPPHVATPSRHGWARSFRSTRLRRIDCPPAIAGRSGHPRPYDRVSAKGLDGSAAHPAAAAGDAVRGL